MSGLLSCTVVAKRRPKQIHTRRKGYLVLSQRRDNARSSIVLVNIPMSDLAGRKVNEAGDCPSLFFVPTPFQHCDHGPTFEKEESLSSRRTGSGEWGGERKAADKRETNFAETRRRTEETPDDGSRELARRDPFPCAICVGHTAACFAICTYQPELCGRHRPDPVHCGRAQVLAPAQKHETTLRRWHTALSFPI